MNQNGSIGTAMLSFLLFGAQVPAADAANQPPMIRLNSPQDGQTFFDRTHVYLVAYAQDPEDGYNVTVQFFEGATNLGVGTFVPTRCAAPYCPNFALAWTNVMAGSHTVTAVATDSNGASTSSDPVQFTVIDLEGQAIVTIFAKDSSASEQSPLVDAAPDTATFVVQRSGGDFTQPLTVSYQIGGAASNGLDYDKLSGEVTIPAQSDTAEIVVNPIDDDIPEGTESIVLALIPVCPPCLFLDPPCLPPVPAAGCYFVGFPGEAVAYVRDNEPVNLQPMVEIVKPQTGDTLAASSNVEIDVRALDPDGWVHSVEFFANNVRIGRAFVEFIQAPPPGQEQMFSLVWSNVTRGKFVLTAKAVDDRGGESWSGPVAIVVGDPTPLVPVISVSAPDSFASEKVSSAGTNTATFRIFRSGPTNSDVTVFYSLHGSASNGVDYAELGNSVVISAGHRAARVVIVPFDDHADEGVETVALNLEPDPTVGPVARYVIGLPARAAAVISDDDQPQTRCCRLSDGSFHLGLNRPVGFAYRLEASLDLSVWVPLCTNVVTDGALRFVDPEALQHRHRFYRIVPQSNYDPEE